MLYLAVARSQGFAGRFVSGYHAEHDDDPPFYPHAWAEIYVTGGGWRGFDPTTGLAVSDRHIAVAWSGLSEQAALVSGSWRGWGKLELRRRPHDRRDASRIVPTLCRVGCGP